MGRINTLTGPIGGSGPAEAAIVAGRAKPRGPVVRQSIQALQLLIASEVILGAVGRVRRVIARRFQGFNLPGEYSR